MAVFNRIDTGLRSPAHAFGAVRVRGHAPAEPVCVSHNRLHFFRRILRSVRVIAFREHATRGANLNHVCAIPDDFADLVLNRLDAVRHSPSLKMKSGRKEAFVAMTTSNSKRRPRSAHARPDGVAIIHSIAQSDVRGITAP